MVKKIVAIFYMSPSGKEPVRDWLKELERVERKAIGEDIKTVEEGWPIGMPTSRSLGHSLYEVRSNLPTEKIARVIFTIKANNMILLHGFIKKSQQTPKPDIDLALKRMKDIK